MMKVAIHEFTHVVISHVNSNISEIPIWMNEGVADLEGKDSYTFGNNGGYLF